MESNENLHRLFSQIFNKTVTHQQLLAVASLLSIWPPFENERDSEGAWYLVLLKLITDANDGLSVVKIASEKDMQLKKKVCNFWNLAVDTHKTNLFSRFFLYRTSNAFLTHFLKIVINFWRLNLDFLLVTTRCLNLS